MGIAINDVKANGMVFRVRSAGDGGEPVILLHGFPETSHMWVGLMPKLAEAGYRSIAPDLRGYSPGARPDDVASYSYEALASDVFALADASGFERFHLVGHDWGAGIGWAAVHIDGGKRIASWTALSIPHYLGFAKATYDDPGGDVYRGILTQLLTEGAFEGAITANADAFRGTWSHSSAEEVDEYLTVLQQPGAMKAAASYYRACNAHKRALEDPSAPFGPTSVPTLLIKGTQDPYVRAMSVELGAPYMKGEYKLVELEAGHWLAQEAPDRVAEEVLAFLRAHRL